jgi:TPR repeat protein
MYRSGLGVKRDYALSAEFNRRGCQGGNALGCTNLGIMYWEGSLLKDDGRAVDLFSKGCQGGDSGGCLGLGFMYENGQGVKRDSRRAAEFYRKGCQGGNERSCRQLANLSSVPIGESASEP